MEQHATSPLPQRAPNIDSPLEEKTIEPMELDFPGAIREIITKGKKVKRVSWKNGEYGFIDDHMLSLSLPDGLHIWQVSEGDLMADDWVIV